MLPNRIFGCYATRYIARHKYGGGVVEDRQTGRLVHDSVEGLTFGAAEAAADRLNAKWRARVRGHGT